MKMVFIKRDAEKRVCAIFASQGEEQLDELANDNPEILEFLARCAMDKKFSFLKSDLEFVRVLEDLIQILMAKNIISITDFSAPVIEKLVARNKIRQQFQDISRIISDES